MDLPREYISYSQIRLYQDCPKKYHFNYIENISLPVNEKVFLGVVFHSAIEHFFNEKTRGNILDVETFTDFFKKKFEELQGSIKVSWENSVSENRSRGVAFARYFARVIAPTIEPLMVEKELWAEIPGIDTRLRGVLDLVETDFSITDFKTTTAKWSKSRIQHSYLQVIMYRYLFEKSFGDVISSLKFKVIYAKSSNNIKHQELSIKPGDVDFDYSRMFEIIRFVIDNIKEGVFYKNEGYACNFCDYKSICKGIPTTTPSK